VCLETSAKPHVHQKFEIFWTNIASTMACPNLKNGPKNGLRPLGVNQQGNGGSNLNPNFNANNFNNGSYNNNPNRYFPQQPMNQNQGWNQLPFGNPNQGNPTYRGQIPRWFNP
jgi:hypothetical protein